MSEAKVKSTVEFVFANELWGDQCESVKLFEVTPELKALQRKTWIDDGHTGHNAMYFLGFDGDDIRIKCWDYFRFSTSDPSSGNRYDSEEHCIDHFEIQDDAWKFTEEAKKEYENWEELEQESLKAFEDEVNEHSIDDVEKHTESTLAKVKTYIYYHIFGKEKAKEYVEKACKTIEGISDETIKELNELVETGTVKREKHFDMLNMLRSMRSLTEAILKETPDDEDLKARLDNINNHIERLENDQDD